MLATSDAADSNLCEEYVRRRLSAIPQIAQFHMHSAGCSYEIGFSGDEESSVVSVEIKTKLKPLPLMDAGMSLMGMTDSDGCLSISVTSTARMQPSWVSDSVDGTDPGKWVRS